MRFSRVMARLWIPLVLLVVFGLGGLTVSRLHGVFGSETRQSYDTKSAQYPTPVAPTERTYEVFGAPGAVADISYFDINGEPQPVHTSLPWTLKITSTPAGSGGVGAHGG